MGSWMTRKKASAGIEAQNASWENYTVSSQNNCGERTAYPLSCTSTSIKNAFNAINHRAIFYVLEAKGFPSEDIALCKRMYTGSFLVMANRFEVQHACSVGGAHKAHLLALES